MSLATRCYQGLLGAAIGLIETFPPRRFDREEVGLRKGEAAESQTPQPGVVWVHGASLGEVNTLRPFVRLLARTVGRDRVLATATTMDGLRRLRADALVEHLALLPLDHPDCLGPFLDRWRPHLVLLAETELWPGLLGELARRAVPVGIVNARLNVRTQRAVQLLRPLFAAGLANLRFVYAQTATMARRYRALGIPRERIHVLGSFKYDIEPPQASEAALRARFGLPAPRRLWTFGSTRPGEEAIILAALAPLWDKITAPVALVPRHLDRVGEIETLLRQHRLDWCRLGDGPIPAGARLVLVDVLGELINLYALSELAFVGGSLVDFGGHNVMEPAACGVAVACGPHTRNFAAEIEALRAAGAVTVLSDAPALRGWLERGLATPDFWRDLGQRARFVHATMGGVASRTMAWLQAAELLPAAGTTAAPSPRSPTDDGADAQSRAGASRGSGGPASAGAAMQPAGGPVAER